MIVFSSIQKVMIIFWNQQYKDHTKNILIFKYSKIRRKWDMDN